MLLKNQETNFLKTKASLQQQIEQNTQETAVITAQTTVVEQAVQEGIDTIGVAKTAIDEIIDTQNQLIEIYKELDLPEDTGHTEEEYYDMIDGLEDTMKKYVGDSKYQYYSIWYTPNFYQPESMVYDYHGYVCSDINGTLVPVLIKYEHDDTVLLYAYGMFDALNNRFAENPRLYWTAKSAENSFITYEEPEDEPEEQLTDEEYFNNISSLIDELGIPEEYAALDPLYGKDEDDPAVIEHQEKMTIISEARSELRKEMEKGE